MSEIKIEIAKNREQYNEEASSKYKVGMVSLGCDKNRVDSEIILGKMSDEYEITNNPKKRRYNYSEYMRIYRECQTRIY